MSLTLEIPDAVEQALRLPRDGRRNELMLELALALYARGILSLGKASELAGMSKIELGLLLGRRGIPRHYGDEELAQDLAYAPWKPI